MTDDRTNEGTKQDRDREHVPLKLRVQYGAMIVIALISTFAATQALSVSGTAQQAGMAARQAALQAKVAAAQGVRIAHLAATIQQQQAATIKAAAAASANTAAVAAQLAADEHATCLIQARGLPASKQMAAIQQDWRKLILTPRPPHSPRLSPRVAGIVRSLKARLNAYLALVAKQPASRSC